MNDGAAPSSSTVITESMQRLLQVRDLWTRSQKDQLEIGRLLYEERKERLSVGGGSYSRDGFHAWLREAGVPKTSGYDPLEDVKRAAAERWVAAVNADRRRGRSVRADQPEPDVHPHAVVHEGVAEASTPRSSLWEEPEVQTQQS